MSIYLENSVVATGLEKVSFHSSPKECSHYHTVAHISHASKVMLKILQVRLQLYMNQEVPGVWAGFRRDALTKKKIPSSIKKDAEFQFSKGSTSL